MNNEEILLRIKELMHDLGYKQGQFADKIGMDRSGFYKRMSGEVATGNAVINKIVLSLGVSKQWLVTGVGEKFPEESKKVPGNGNSFNSTVYYPIPIISPSSHHDYINNCKDDSFIKTLYTIPQKIDSFFEAKYRILNAVGDAMNDGTTRSILNNDLVMGREIDRKHFISNSDYLIDKIYIVIAVGGIFLSKLTSINKKTSIANFNSFNPLYDNISIKLSDIIELYSAFKIVERAL